MKLGVFSGWRRKWRTILFHFLLSCCLVPLALCALLALSLRRGWISLDAHQDSSVLEAKLAGWARRWASESKFRNLRNPVAANNENIECGAIYYREYCAQCHRGTADASPLDGALFNPRPPGLAELENASHQELFWYAKRGIRVTGMPSFQEILSDEALWQIAAFLKERHRNKLAMEILKKKEYVETTSVEYTVDGKATSAQELEKVGGR